MVFESYVKLVPNFKNYDSITKDKMIDAIVNELNNPEVIISLCTTKELKLLKDLINNKDGLLNEYELEIFNLKNKNILLNSYLLKIPDDIIESVKKAIEIVDWKKAKENDDINEILVGFIKCNGEMLEMAILSIMPFLTNKKVEEIKKHIETNRLFKFYVYKTYTYMETFNDDIPTFIYHDYYDFIDILAEQRKKYATVSISKDIDLKNYINMFYYGLNINNSKVKKLYDFINDNDLNITIKQYIINSLAISSLLLDKNEEIYEVLANTFEDNKDQFLKLVHDAYDEIPSGALNGLTPKERMEILSREINMEKKKNSVNEKQINACLSPKDADLFYKIYFALLEYTNNKYNINTSLKKIYKAKHINPNDLTDIIDKLWDEKEQIITSFIKENPYKFNKSELIIVEDFKRGIRNVYVIARFLKNYTVVTSDDAVYMIKGVNDNIDNIIFYTDLPFMCKTTLIPFKNFIIYDGIFVGYAIKPGVNFTENVEKSIEEKEHIYKL